jgi:hypothetical protein
VIRPFREFGYSRLNLTINAAKLREQGRMFSPDAIGIVGHRGGRGDRCCRRHYRDCRSAEGGAAGEVR